MRIVLAALDTSAAARPVLETAIRLAQLTGADVEAVHVASPGQPVETPASLAARAGVDLRLLEGPVVPTLLAALHSEDTLAAVIGARATPGGRRPVGSTALRILEKADKAVMVVPPEAVSPGLFRRLLVPLEGTDISSRPVLERLAPLLVAEAELVVLHVFNESTLPAMLDRPEYDLEILGKEFLARHFPDAKRIELRPGPIAQRVAEVSEEQGTDLIVLSWSQDSSGGRAQVIQDVLGTSTIPVLLLPAADPTSPPPHSRP
jgi:nucleotide-binding universal stress UspA family protein